MIYRVRHRTTYDYEDPVSVSHHVVRLTPRNLPEQTCRGSHVSILPTPPVTSAHFDYFGNTRDLLHAAGASRLPDRGGQQRLGGECHRTHRIFPRLLHGRPCLAFGQGSHRRGTGRLSVRFRYSQRVRANQELAEYARESFPEGRPLLEAAFDLTRRIHQRFSLRQQSDRSLNAGGDILRKAPRRVPGLRPSPDRVHAISSASPHVTSAAICAPCRRRDAAFDRRGCLARLVLGLVLGAGWMDFDPTNNCIRQTATSPWPGAAITATSAPSMVCC